MYLEGLEDDPLVRSASLAIDSASLPPYCDFSFQTLLFTLQNLHLH
jgi:hypothetical protein